MIAPPELTIFGQVPVSLLQRQLADLGGTELCGMYDSSMYNAVCDSRASEARAEKDCCSPFDHLTLSVTRRLPCPFPAPMSARPPNLPKSRPRYSQIVALIPNRTVLEPSRPAQRPGTNSHPSIHPSIPLCDTLMPEKKTCVYTPLHRKNSLQNKRRKNLEWNVFPSFPV
ncbi:hypothetical protein VTK56DRAFT_9471 [Thermocarpiscus australiensis]